jgi:hypothetical protein
MRDANFGVAAKRSMRQTKRCDSRTPEEIYQAGPAEPRPENDFWKRYLELGDAPVKVCEACGKAEVMAGKDRRIVQAALRTGKEMTVANLFLICNKCRPIGPLRKPRAKKTAARPVDPRQMSLFEIA